MHRRLAIALVVILALAAAPEALATIAGPCEATVAGEDVLARDTFAKSDAISVPQTGGVPVTMTAERPIDDLKLEIEFAGFKYTVLDEPTTTRNTASGCTRSSGRRPAKASRVKRRLSSTCRAIRSKRQRERSRWAWSSSAGSASSRSCCEEVTEGSRCSSPPS